MKYIILYISLLLMPICGISQNYQKLENYINLGLKEVVNEELNLIKSTSKKKYYLALINFQKEKYDSTIFFLSKIDQLNAKEEILLLQANYYINNGELDARLKLSTTSSSKLYIEAFDLFQKERYKEANDKLSEIDKPQVNQFDYYLLKAKIYYSIEDFQNAKDNFTMCLDFNPYFGECYWLRFKCNKQLGIKKEANYDLNKAYENFYLKKTKYKFLQLVN